MLETGQIFAGRYRVRRRLAEGGMGAIFEAEHLGTERRVALKLLFPHIMSVASAREKFELEAKVAARVDSPHIVQVLDAGYDEASKSPYLVMELLHGDTLGGMVKSRGPLPPREVVALLRQVAAGLDAAHGYRDPSGSAMPIVHRDLKPENIFVCSERDGAALVKILDFGIAKVLSDTGNVSQEVRGTPLYMAFEQVTASRLSPATDIWALGLIAYYALTGERYWRSASAEGAGVQSLFAEILTLPLEAPSVRMQQQGVASTFGEGFDAWLLCCINREPARRFAAAGAAVEALAQVFSTAPSVPARAPAPLSLAAGRTATLPVASSEPVGVVTAPSLSAVASERAPSESRAPAPRRRLAATIAAVGAGVLMIVAGVYWLSGAGVEGPGGVASGVSPAALEQAPEPPAPASEPRSAEPPAAVPAEPAARAPVVAPIVAPVTTAPDAGARGDTPGDYPVPSWPPPALPGEETSGAAPSGEKPKPARSPAAAPAAPAPAPAAPRVRPAPAPVNEKSKPKPKFNPYDMR